MARCGCGTTCACAVGADPACPDVSVSGDGSAGSPYLVCVTQTPSADDDNAIVVGSDDRLWAPIGPHRLEETELSPFPHPWARDDVMLADRIAAFVFFPADRDVLAVGFRILSGSGAPATGSPARLGLYTVNVGGDLTLVAQSAAADTATLSAAYTYYEPAIAADGAGAPLASYQLTRGSVYAIGVWTDSDGAGTAAGYDGRSAAATNRGSTKRARVRSSVDAALPAAVLAGGMTDSAAAIWAAVSA